MHPRKRRKLHRTLVEVPLELAAILSLAALSFIALIAVYTLVHTTIKLIGIL